MAHSNLFKLSLCFFQLELKESLSVFAACELLFELQDFLFLILACSVLRLLVVEKGFIDLLDKLGNLSSKHLIYFSGWRFLVERSEVL